MTAENEYFQRAPIWDGHNYRLRLLLRAWMALILPLALGVLPLFSELSSSSRLFNSIEGGDQLHWMFIIAPVLGTLDILVYGTKRVWVKFPWAKRHWVKYIQVSAYIHFLMAGLLSYFVLLMSYHMGVRDALLLIYVIGSGLTVVTAFLLLETGLKGQNPSPHQPGGEVYEKAV